MLIEDIKKLSNDELQTLYSSLTSRIWWQIVPKEREIEGSIRSLKQELQKLGEEEREIRVTLSRIDREAGRRSGVDPDDVPM